MMTSNTLDRSCSWRKRPHSGVAVTIQPVAGRSGDYLASFHSEPLDATFSVYFRDTLPGALALHSFAEAISSIVTRQG